jgi:anti-anti-sigma factor
LSRLSFRTNVTGDVAVIALEGELDIAGAELLEHEMERVIGDHDPGALVLDLSRLEFMDSTGLRLVVLASDDARRAQRSFALVRGRPEVHRVFEITRMNEWLRFVESAEEAASP